MSGCPYCKRNGLDHDRMAALARGEPPPASDGRDVAQDLAGVVWTETSLGDEREAARAAMALVAFIRQQSADWIAELIGPRFDAPAYASAEAWPADPRATP